MDIYPAHENISSIEPGKTWLPSYLGKFMTTLVKKELKQVSLGQVLVNAVKPRTPLSPIMSEKVFVANRAEQLLTEQSRLGFSVNPDDVTLYK